MGDRSIWLRVGWALTPPTGPNKRQREYEMIVDEQFPDSVMVRYKGYREQTEKGEVRTGLPSAGPGAWWRQPVIKFHPGDFSDVRRFKKPVKVEC